MSPWQARRQDRSFRCLQARRARRPGLSWRSMSTRPGPRSSAWPMRRTSACGYLRFALFTRLRILPAAYPACASSTAIWILCPDGIPMHTASSCARSASSSSSAPMSLIFLRVSCPVFIVHRPFRTRPPRGGILPLHAPAAAQLPNPALTSGSALCRGSAAISCRMRAPSRMPSRAVRCRACARASALQGMH